MLNNNFVATSFTDGLLYKPSDINALVESNYDETYKFLKIKIIIEKLNVDSEIVFNETIDALEAYRLKVEKTIINENQKKSLITEITNLMLGILKFITPWVMKLIGWLTGMVVNTKTFGKMATTVSNAAKKVTPDAIKKAITFAKDNYNKADAAFQSIATSINQKVQDAFKGTSEKPPIVNVDAIKKAHDNLVAKIEKWPGVGKLIGLGKKLGIGSKGFYTFLALTVLSIFAMTGSMGAAIILVLYGANVAAQRVVKAGKEVGQDVANKAAQGIAKAQGETSPTPQATSDGDIFADLEKELDAELSGGTKQEQNSLAPDLEDASNKWAQKFRGYIDRNEKDNGISKIKEALKQLIQNNNIKKEEVKPFIDSVMLKAKVTDDIKQALMGAMSDIAVV